MGNEIKLLTSEEETAKTLLSFVNETTSVNSCKSTIRLTKRLVFSPFVKISTIPGRTDKIVDSSGSISVSENPCKAITKPLSVTAVEDDSSREGSRFEAE